MYKSRKSGGHMTFWWLWQINRMRPLKTISNVTSEADMAARILVCGMTRKKKFLCGGQYYSIVKNTDCSLVHGDVNFQKWNRRSFPENPKFLKGK
jgi:hypothetical protein